MATIEIDADRKTQVADLYYKWQQSQGFQVIALPPVGGPYERNQITLNLIETEFLEVLRNEGITFTVL